MQVRALARACIFFFIRNIIMILGSREDKVRSNPLVSWGKIPFDHNIIIIILGRKCKKMYQYADGDE